MASQSTALKGPVLLITDLSARCDRALDRAVSLARQHNVKLIALHVIEPSFLSRLILPSWNIAQKEHQEVARQRLLNDLKDVSIDLEVMVEIGYPVDTINEVASLKNCSLIVSGTARDESLGRIMLGSTVERLARQCPTPLLVVRRRPFDSYGHILVGTDFSESSRYALEAALDLVPHQKLTVYHSFDEVAGVRTLDAATIEETTRHLQRKTQEFLDQTPKVSQIAAPEVVVEYGAAGQSIPKYVQQQKVELVVLGTHGATGILKTAMGSIAEQLLTLLRCDVMIVRTRRD